MAIFVAIQFKKIAYCLELEERMTLRGCENGGLPASSSWNVQVRMSTLYEEV